MWKFVLGALLLLSVPGGDAGAADDGAWSGSLFLAMRSRIDRVNWPDSRPTLVLGSRWSYDDATLAIQGGQFVLRTHDGDELPLTGTVEGTAAGSHQVQLSEDAGEWIRSRLAGISDWDPTVSTFAPRGVVRLSRSGRKIQLRLRIENVSGRTNTDPGSNFEHSGRMLLRMRAQRM